MKCYTVQKCILAVDVVNLVTKVQPDYNNITVIRTFIVLVDYIKLQIRLKKSY